MRLASPFSVLLMGLVVSSGAALASDSLGAYVGGAVGQSRGSTELSANDYVPISGRVGPTDIVPSFSFDHSSTARLAMVGIRPLSAVGAEAEYVDFGSSGAVTVPSGAFEGTATTHPKAVALFAVGYLPIPLPYLDIFGKVGAAELKTDISAVGNLFGSNCGFRNDHCDPVGPLKYSADGSSTRLTYGAGMQVKLHHLALRAEYDRISAPGGDPELLSLGLIWEF